MYARSVRRISRVPGARASTSVSNIRSGRSSSDQVRLVEVGPRDGLQNEPNPVPFVTKMTLIDRLSQTGLINIEAGAMVSPKWVPQVSESLNSTAAIVTAGDMNGIDYQCNITPNEVKHETNSVKMADSEKILRRLCQSASSDTTTSPLATLHSDIKYPFLIPNLRGLERALVIARSDASLDSKPSTLSSATSLRDISIFLSATETFSQKNLNCSIEDSLDRARPVFTLAKTHNIRVRAYISVVLGCPYEGLDVPAARIADMSIALLEMGAEEISLGDTIGTGTVSSVRNLLRTLEQASIPSHRLAVHFHDTYGQALVNYTAALDRGLRTFDSSVAGLGGCPYAKGATGNVATEDLVCMLDGMGLETGVDWRSLAEIGGWISDELGRPNESKAGRAWLKANNHQPG